MMRNALIALLIAGPATAETYHCDTPIYSYRVSVMQGGCAVGEDAGLLDRREGRIECRISNPQLRIVTVDADLSFVYEDTDNDRIIRGRCRRLD